MSDLTQTLKDIMTANVASVTPNQTVQEAANLMSQYNVGSLPVVENGQVRGIVTDRDITLRSTAQGKANTTTVSEVMSSQDIVEGQPGMDVHQAAQLMAQRQVRRLPVVENGQLVGIVALGDLATQNIYQDDAEQALSNISVPSKPQM